MRIQTFKRFCLYSAVFLLCGLSAPILNAASGNSSSSSYGDGEFATNYDVRDVCADDGKTCCKVCTPKFPANCGNAVVEAGEECESSVGVIPPGWRCNAQCIKERIPPACGNGIKTDDEQCDDGNNDNTDACTNACQIAVCRDNIVRAGTEACDDGNVVNGDGCSSACQYEYVCGNGTPESGEQCDDGNTDNDDGCSSTCQNEAVCGNDYEEAGETCDDGNLVGGDGCDADCQEESLCGNGNDDQGEACDDGNAADGDGCDSSCQYETIELNGTVAQDRNASGTATYSGNVEVTSGHTILSWTATSTTPAICQNPSLPTGSGSAFSGEYLEGQNLNECKLSFTATDNLGQTSQPYSITVPRATTPCSSYADDDGDVRSSLSECLDGESFTCTSSWVNTDGTCVCSAGTETSC